jgi:hypothetical protein
MFLAHFILDELGNELARTPDVRTVFLDRKKILSGDFSLR